MKNIFCLTFAVAIVVAFGFSQAAQADDWGTLTGRFVYDGKAPTAAKITPNKDVEVCGKHELNDESLVVDDKGGVANVFIWNRSKDVKVAPEYAATAKEKVVLDNHDCRFQPHALAIRTTQSLEVKNSDPMGHNTNGADLKNNAPFNGIIPAGKDEEMTLSVAESFPAKIICNIHPWMSAYLLVRPDPYFAVSGKDGKFEIKNLPAGTELEFQVWQEKAGNVDKASIGGKDANWRRGRFKYTVKAGANDLGDIKLDPSQFNK
jgi:plastocyanin